MTRQRPYAKSVADVGGITCTYGSMEHLVAAKGAPDMAFMFARNVAKACPRKQTLALTMIVKKYTTKKNSFVGLECSIHRPTGDLQKHGNDEMIRIARAIKAPLLLTIDSHFIKPDQKKLQDIILMSTVSPWAFSNSYHIPTVDEAWTTWNQVQGTSPATEAQFIEALENNQAVVDMIDQVGFKKEFHMKEPDLPIDIASTDRTRDQKIEDYVMRLVAEHDRLPTDGRRSEYIARLKMELDVIARNPTVNFLPYFLILHDICVFAREQEIMVGPGRGSAAGSLLAFLLKITHLDPILFNLSFARFLSLGRIRRGKLPDIDTDFSDPKVVVDHLKELHGDLFARVSTTGTMKLKGALRDVSRALLDTKSDKAMADRIESICKTMPKSQTKSDSRAYLYGWEDEEGAHPGVIDMSKELREFLEEFPDVKNGLDGVLDIPRSMGRHASAYCLSDINIGDICPMCVINEEVCTQFSMDPIGSLGFLKVDLLGVNTLSDIQQCLKWIKDRAGISIDPYNFDHIPIDDPAVYDDFCAGKTETVFQFKTEIATDLCKRIKPRNLMDLSAITANGRPGAMYALMEDGETTLVESWVARRNGTAPVTYIHPDLEEILESTSGVCTFQEQMMAAFQKCCGYDEERSDEVRELIGKKKTEVLDRLIPEIRQSLLTRGWSDQQAGLFVGVCQAAAKYSFNVSHSACYSYLGYICAWLKHYYPLEWWTAVLSNSSADDLRDNAHLCKDFVVPPDINRSLLDFYIIDSGREKIVYPLGMIRSVKKAGVDIVAKRPYDSLEDFYNRVDRRIVHRGVMSWLIWAGAFDLLCGVTRPVERNRVYREYLALRGDLKPEKYPPELNEFEVLLKHNEALPLNAADFGTLIQQQTGKRILSYEAALKLPHKKRVLVAGVIVKVHVHTPKKVGGKTMCFLGLADKSTLLDVTVFNDTYELRKDRLKEGNVVLVDGKVNSYNGKVGIVADDVTAFGITLPEDSEGDAESEVIPV